jgi:small subunit ribosomal protein S17
MPRRIFSGEVVSDSCEKSVVVKVTKRIMHPIYKKFVKRSKKFMAHDENNSYKVGDFVKIRESKPFSKRKSWEVLTSNI